MGKEAEKVSNKKSKNKKDKKKPIKTTENEGWEEIKDEKPNFLKKRFRLIIPLIIIVCIIVFAWFILNPGVVADEIKAQLIIDSGTVQVKSADGSWTSAENGMDLYESYSVKTGHNSSASIVLFKTSIVRLDSDTEVTLKELIREEETKVTIQQDSGRTWNTVSKISGIDNYEVQTPTTVASVRGTAFVVIVQENGSTYYGVHHGILNVSSISKNVVQGSIDVSGNESVFVFIDLINETLEVKPFEMDEWVIENLLDDEQFVSDLKQELYERIEEYIPELKAEYGITDEELDVLLIGYILGYFDLPDDSPEWIKELFEFS
jgi:hypothetical protein